MVKVLGSNHLGTLIEVNLSTMAFVSKGGERLQLQQSIKYGDTEFVTMSAKTVLKLAMLLDKQVL